MQVLGKYLILAGIVMIVIGCIVFFGGKTAFLGKLPGDILVRKENFTFYFPITTSIFLSLVLSLILFFFFRK